MGLKTIQIYDEDAFARLIRRAFTLMWLVGCAAIGFDQFVIDKGPVWPFITTAIVAAISLAGTYLVLIGGGKRLFRQSRDTTLRKLMEKEQVEQGGGHVR
jgi:hypothetical protein